MGVGSGDPPCSSSRILGLSKYPLISLRIQVTSQIGSFTYLFAKWQVRIQYIIWNAAAIGLLYAFNDSLLSAALTQHDYVYLSSFHFVQLITITAFYITSFRNPGYVEKVTLRDLQRELLSEESSGNESEERNPLKKRQKKSLITPRDPPTNRPHRTSRNKNGRAYLDVNVEYTFDSADCTPDCVPYQVVEYAPAYSHKILVDRDAPPSNYCWRCQMIRPIRSKHCYDCDRCIGKFDHHCPMVGNCVGGRNHRFFVLFLVFQSVTILWAFYITIHSLFQFGRPIKGQYESRYVQLSTQLIVHI